MLNYDVVILGSGVAGMTAAIYLRRAGIQTLIIENDTPGGQMNKSFCIENYPGFKSIDGPSLAYNIYSQVLELKTDYLFSNIESVDLKKKKIITNKKEVKYRYLIISTGRSPRKLDLTNEEKLLGRGISYCALCDGNLYKNKNVIVVGGGNSALEEALYLSGICNKVTLIHRKDIFNAEKVLIDKVTKNKKIDIIYNANLINYNIKDNKLVSVSLDTKKKIKTDGVFISIGYVPNSSLFEVKKERNYILTYTNYVTSMKSVYACGDIIKKDTYQITTAIGEAAVVANKIIKLLK